QKGHLQIQIGRRRSLDQDHLIRMFRPFPHELTENVRRGWCMICLNHFPLACGSSVIQCPNNKVTRQHADGIGVECPQLRLLIRRCLWADRSRCCPYYQSEDNKRPNSPCPGGRRAFHGSPTPCILSTAVRSPGSTGTCSTGSGHWTTVMIMRRS